MISREATAAVAEVIPLLESLEGDTYKHLTYTASVMALWCTGPLPLSVSPQVHQIRDKPRQVRNVGYF